MRLYVSGKITGDPDYQIKFIDAVFDLLQAGYKGIENPCCYVSADDDWNTAMRKVLAVMLTCDGLALLHDWKDSKGAMIETRLAYEVGIPVKPIEAWIAEVAE